MKLASLPANRFHNWSTESVDQLIYRERKSRKHLLAICSALISSSYPKREKKRRKEIGTFFLGIKLSQSQDAVERKKERKDPVLFYSWKYKLTSRASAASQHIIVQVKVDTGTQHLAHEKNWQIAQTLLSVCLYISKWFCTVIQSSCWEILGRLFTIKE